MLIDVMLPFYGDVGLMQQAVRSVLAQTHGDFRLVVVDDQYPDPAVAQWFADITDPRVTYVRNETNLGVNGNFRRCVELVAAPVFTVMGGDDVMLPGHLAALARIFEQHPDTAVVQPGVEVIDASGDVVRPRGDRIKSALAPRRRTTLVGETMAASLYRGNWTYFPSLGWDAEAVRSVGFRPGLDVVLDLALLIDLAAAGGSFVIDPAVTFQYRRHDASVCSVQAFDGRRFDEERAFFVEEAAACAARGWPKARRAARAHLTSRLNAASLLPGVALGKDWPAARALARHTLR